MPLLRAEILLGRDAWSEQVIRDNWDFGRQQCSGGVEGLCKRRDNEVELFLTGVYPEDMYAEVPR